MTHKPFRPRSESILLLGLALLFTDRFSPRKTGFSEVRCGISVARFDSALSRR